jgi:hypothetical protein
MKKVLLPLLMLLAIAGLLAVESSPSAIVGYVKYANYTGLNTIALPLEQNFTLSSEVGIACGANATSIVLWDGATQSWQQSDYYPAPDDVWDPDFPVQAGSAMFVNASDAFNFYSMGTIPTPPTYNLYTGLNLAMIPLNRSDLTGTDLLGATMPTASSIILWDGSTQSWQQSDYYPAPDDVWDPFFTTSIGMPFFVNSLSETTWPGAKTVKTLKASRASK